MTDTQDTAGWRLELAVRVSSLLRRRRRSGNFHRSVGGEEERNGGAVVSRGSEVASLSRPRRQGGR
jgi:hypothetical protein